MSEEVALAPQAELGAEAVDLLQRLIRIDTSNPPGNEARGAGAARASSSRRRLRVRAARRATRSARTWSRGSRRAPRARRCACSATSTRSPPTRPSGAATRGPASFADGEVWGRGALDMKGQVAAEVAAAASLARGRLAARHGRAARRHHRRRGAGRGLRRQMAVRGASRAGALRPRRQRGRRAGDRVRRAALLHRLRSARRASSGSGSAPTGAPATRRCRGSGTTRC